MFSDGFYFAILPDRISMQLEVLKESRNGDSHLSMPPRPTPVRYILRYGLQGMTDM